VTAASFSLLASQPFPITRFDDAATGADRTYGYAEETRSKKIDRNQGLRTRVFKARVLEYLHLLPHSSKKIVFKIKSNSHW
jgi:hypothetical protein